MPLFFTQNINENTRLGIWHITENEEFFLEKVPLQRDINHPNKRLQHLAGRFLLQHLFPDFPYHELVIADSRKPYLPYEQYHFSISHCGDFAAAIVSKSQRVGIDIEVPTAKVQKIVPKFLHEEERNWLVAQVNALAPAQDDYRLPTLLWSAKEAAFKWWSFGSVDFSEDIRLDPFEFSEKGLMNGVFKRGEEVHPLAFYFQLFPGVCMVYTL
ncbi:Phosphopantetheinyl transferase [Filimonas lacunae]|uniref:Enterobactin synthase component D n=1 Tax=Filimonas lacunae TaxID=477680 RepID=A0A173MDD9_9BACT|nr:4'-phosphopantetheinyl transferase superfamily protein [Filimonas lacunae]BAV05604.1 siderophore biosynthesis regulatory protein [Filimonas lacunae]SIT29225.1 Phosphopantetheinyl transferase [Filimonas lacunae]